MPPKINPCTHNGPDWGIFRGLQARVSNQIDNHENLTIAFVISFAVFLLWNIGLTIDACDQRQHMKANFEQAANTAHQETAAAEWKIIETQSDLYIARSDLRGLMTYLDVERNIDVTDTVEKIDHSKKKPELILCCQ